MKREQVVEWSKDAMLKVALERPEDFLVVRETLTRMGIPSKDGKTLYQSCHILHKRGEYYIVSFKELFNLDGRENALTETDLTRRDKIAMLLEDWGLLKIVGDPELRTGNVNLEIIKSHEKDEWKLEPKYRLGN